MQFLLEIITPQRLAFSEEIDALSVPSGTGILGVLAHHEPLFCSLIEGEIKISSGTKEFFLAIGGGFMEVSEKKVSILVSRAVHADELNEAELKKAAEDAKKAIENASENIALEHAQSILRRSMLELKVYHRKSKRHSTLPN